MNGPTPVLKQLKTSCSECSLHLLCMPAGLSHDEMRMLDALTETHCRVLRGEPLYVQGLICEQVYAIRVGCFKTVLLTEDGREQITGFHMAGETLGFDGIGSGTHPVTAIALEDSEACLLPLGKLEVLARELPALQRHFHRLMSREIQREQGVMLMLGSLSADERVTAFLLNISERMATRGYSPNHFVLRMTREEIGSFLGLKLETVSRAFSALQKDGLIAVRNRDIELLDLARLRQRLGGARLGNDESAKPRNCHEF
jgi:CRP/FNR family transcriptional regulator